MSTFIESILTMITPEGAVKTKPLLQQDLINNVNHGYSNRGFRFAFGKNTNVDNTLVDLWEWPTWVYVFPTSPISMVAVSTNAQDSANGTGIRTIHIDTLDENYILTSQVVTLNGTTPVALTGTILRVNYIHATTVWSNGYAVWDISIKNVGWTVTYSIIKAGWNVARSAIRTVPAWYTGYISHWQASAGSTTGTHFTQVILQSTAIQETRYPGVFLVSDETGLQNGSTEINFPIPLMFPERTDIKMSAISDNANADVTVVWMAMGWVEPND